VSLPVNHQAHVITRFEEVLSRRIDQKLTMPEVSADVRHARPDACESIVPSSSA
jgi:hypothetical protein